MDVKAASKLLHTLDDDVIEYVIEQGSEAVDALSRWSKADLLKHGPELALRAKQDARVLEAASKLVDLLKNMDIQDAKELVAIIKNQGSIGVLDTDMVREAKELLDTIAYNSIQNSGDRIVLGKWVSGTFDDGFIGFARSKGALFYGTNPGLEEIFATARNINSEELFWSVNNRVLEIAKEQDLIIDYSLKGLPDIDEITKEISAIKLIESGVARQTVASRIFDGKFPFRMREVDFLVANGYKATVEEATNIIHWIKR